MHAHCYRITVEGALNSVFCEEFEDFAIEPTGAHTSLVADLDQAALYGALIRIQSLGLELTEIARTSNETSCHRNDAGIR